MRSLGRSFALALLACAAPAAAQAAPVQPAAPVPSACEDATHHQFDFWLGGWVRQVGQQSNDGGQSWQAQYDFTHKPAQ